VATPAPPVMAIMPAISSPLSSWSCQSCTARYVGSDGEASGPYSRGVLRTYSRHFVRVSRSPALREENWVVGAKRGWGAAAAVARSCGVGGFPKESHLLRVSSSPTLRAGGCGSGGRGRAYGHRL
jgi:hypothetical protein